MRSLKIIRLLWTFYENFLLLSAIVTLFCVRLFAAHGFDIFFGIFWCKLLTLALTYYFVDINKKNEYYYYQNLGIAKTLLWSATLSFDFLLFILCLVLSNHLQ